MQVRNWLALAASVFLISPAFATTTTTYYGGLEDWNNPASDYDYNDLVYSLSGTGLTLHTFTGAWFSQASAGVLNVANGPHAAGPVTPFWNNPSLDGPGGFNIGFCVWSGGACNGGVGLAPSSQYLATSAGGVVNDVYFSDSGSVTEQVYLSNTIATDSLGWQLLSGGPIYWFSSGVQGPVTFNPNGSFILVAQNATVGATYYSDAATSDGSSHFAFFSPAAVPEPSTFGVFGLTLMAANAALRRVKRSGSHSVPTT